MNQFQSKDFYCSAYLICMGEPLADFQRRKGYTEFFFQENEAVRNLVKEFYSLQAAVEPIKYSQALRALKGIIHSSSGESLSTSTSDQGIINNVKQYRSNK